MLLFVATIYSSIKIRAELHYKSSGGENQIDPLTFECLTCPKKPNRGIRTKLRYRCNFILKISIENTIFLIFRTETKQSKIEQKQQNANFYMIEKYYYYKCGHAK